MNQKVTKDFITRTSCATTVTVTVNDGATVTYTGDVEMVPTAAKPGFNQ